MKLRITEMSPAILILLSKDTIIHGWLNMCDPHSELVQCSISPLCVSVWRDIQLLQQAPSAHLESIHPPVWGHDAALWHPLTCHCCREAAALPSSSLWHLFLNILHSNTHYIGHNPEHISDCVNSNDALPTVFVSKHVCDAAHPPSLLLPDWRWNGPAVFMLSQLSSAWSVSLPVPPMLRNLCCGPQQGHT